jgi:hypothetical protein
MGPCPCKIYVFYIYIYICMNVYVYTWWGKQPPWARACVGHGSIQDVCIKIYECVCIHMIGHICLERFVPLHRDLHAPPSTYMQGHMTLHKLALRPPPFPL